jgi:pimeloyl-ACP methyl ester carboxylesterase
MSGITRKFVEVEGRRTCYHECGAGPLLVIWASMFILAKSYHKAAAALAPYFHVVVVEAPGSGMALRLSQPWGLEDYARWADQFLRTLGVERCFMIGHSNAAAPSLVAAALYPQHIASLMLIETTGGCRQSLFVIMASRLVDAVFEWKLTLPATFHMLFNVMRHLRNFLNQMLLASRSNIHSYAPQVFIPTLFTWARRDHTIPRLCVKNLAHHARHGEYKEIPEGSHDWLITHPDILVTLSREFFLGEEAPIPPSDLESDEDMDRD